MKEPQKNNGQLPSLEALGKSIDALHKKVVPASKPAPSDGIGFAMQLGIELVAGVGVGTGAGLLLDKWLHTSPFGLVICFLLGTAGGALTLYRTAMANSKTDESDKNSG
jgi:F0F1-type ATP synthase assembly protein I